MSEIASEAIAAAAALELGRNGADAATVEDYLRKLLSGTLDEDGYDGYPDHADTAAGDALVAAVIGRMAVAPEPPPELAAAMAETRAVREGYPRLCEAFGPSGQSGHSARISLPVLNRHRVLAGLAPLSPREAQGRPDTWDRQRAEIKRLQRLVREALFESEMDTGQVGQWLARHDVPDLDDEDGL